MKTRVALQRALLLAAFVCLVIGGCSSSCEDRETCTSKFECSDGIFCNGEELCAPDHPEASAFGCLRGIACNDRPPLPGQSRITCKEQERTCEGTDPTFCTHDVECSDGVFCNGYERCVPDGAGTNDRGCKAGIPPCGPGLTCWEEPRECEEECPDRDRDGVEDAACGGGDCDDLDPSRFPGNPEICDSFHDEDCDVDTIGNRDHDGDGFIDAQCGNIVGDQERYGDDCDDRVALIHPGATEVCNEVDDDCDGDIDEDVSVLVYPDDDFDGYGATGSTPESRCPGPGVSTVDTDCDDSNPYIMPGGIMCVSTQTSNMAQCVDGEWEFGFCPNQQSCVDQPSGMGVCVPRG